MEKTISETSDWEDYETSRKKYKKKNKHKELDNYQGMRDSPNISEKGIGDQSILGEVVIKSEVLEDYQQIVIKSELVENGQHNLFSDLVSGGGSGNGESDSPLVTLNDENKIEKRTKKKKHPECEIMNVDVEKEDRFEKKSKKRKLEICFASEDSDQTNKAKRKRLSGSTTHVENDNDVINAEDNNEESFKTRRKKKKKEKQCGSIDVNHDKAMTNSRDTQSVSVESYAKRKRDGYDRLTDNENEKPKSKKHKKKENHSGTSAESNNVRQKDAIGISLTADPKHISEGHLKSVESISINEKPFQKENNKKKKDMRNASTAEDYESVDGDDSVSSVESSVSVLSQTVTRDTSNTPRLEHNDNFPAAEGSVATPPVHREVHNRAGTCTCLDEKDPEIAALHDTDTIHPRPGFLESLKQRGLLLVIAHVHLFHQNL